SFTTLALGSSTANRTAAGGTLSMAASAAMTLAGSTGGVSGSNFPANFSSHVLDAASTVDYNAAGGTGQTIASAPTYGNLVLSRGSGSGTTTKTLGGTTTVGSTLTVSANAALDVSTQTLILNGALSATGSQISSASTGTVQYNQSSTGQVVVAANYGNLTFSDFAKTLPASGPIGVAGAFTPGSATGHTITNSTIDFTGGGAQSIPAFTYFNLSSSSGGARTLASTGTISVAGQFTPGSHAYTVTGSTVQYNGASTQTQPVSFTY